MLDFYFCGKNIVMKRLLVFIVIVIFISLTCFVKNSSNPLFTLAETDRVCLIVEDGSLSEGEIIDSGSVDFVYMSKEEALKATKNVILHGVEFYLSNIEVEEIIKILKADVIKESEIGGLNLIYAYSPFYQDNITMDGKKVNVQLALKGDEIIAGFPIILTGY